MEPLCHNPLCPNNREMVPKADMLCKDVRYFLGPIPGQRSGSAPSALR